MAQLVGKHRAGLCQWFDDVRLSIIIPTWYREGGTFESVKNTQVRKMYTKHTRYAEEKCRCAVFEDEIFLFEEVRDIELKITCNLHVRIAAIARLLIFPDDAQDPVDRVGVIHKARIAFA